jgi:cytochrome c biogenesis protein CcdA
LAYSTTYKFIDRGIFEILGPTGLSMLVINISSSLHSMQTNYIYHYSLVILTGITILFGARELEFLKVSEFVIDYRLIIIIFILIFFIVNYNGRFYQDER